MRDDESNWWIHFFSSSLNSPGRVYAKRMSGSMAWESVICKSTSMPFLMSLERFILMEDADRVLVGLGWGLLGFKFLL